MCAANLFLGESIMKKKTLLTAGFLCILCASAFAAAPLGPPTAGLEQYCLSAGYGYAHGESDVEADWESAAGRSLGRTKIKDFKSDAHLFRLGYGASDNVEIGMLLGAADGSGKIRGENFDGGYDVSGGLGVKITFLKRGKLSCGFLYQILWSQSDDSYIADLSSSGGPASAVIDAEARWRETVIAVGPSYEMEDLRIYGGLGAYLLDGNVDRKYLDTTFDEADIEQESQFGGYFGGEFDLGGNAFFHVEYQLTGDASVLGVGITGKF
jgi:hypothetical protein